MQHPNWQILINSHIWKRSKTASFWRWEVKEGLSSLYFCQQGYVLSSPSTPTKYEAQQMFWEQPAWSISLYINEGWVSEEEGKIMFTREEQEDFRHLGNLMMADGKSWLQREGAVHTSSCRANREEIGSAETAQEGFSTSSERRVIAWICKNRGACVLTPQTTIVRSTQWVVSQGDFPSKKQSICIKQCQPAKRPLLGHLTTPQL